MSMVMPNFKEFPQGITEINFTSMVLSGVKVEVNFNLCGYQNQLTLKSKSFCQIWKNFY